MTKSREAFVGIDAAKLCNAVGPTENLILTDVDPPIG
jgi:hypothetical protein